MGRTRKKNLEEGGSIRPDVRVRLRAGEAFYGPGVQQLLTGIAKTGSLQEACLTMELSYSKGRKMIKRLEEQMGCAITRRQAGGTGGGGSVLTETGAQLVDSYERMTAEIRDFAEAAFERYMGNEFWKQGGEEE